MQEKGSNEIVFKAMGRAINKTVTIVELIKVRVSIVHCGMVWLDLLPSLQKPEKMFSLVLQRRIVGLHQNTSIGSTDITDTWEPLEEGLLP